MPARDMYHDVVKKALINDGWTITHDPLPLQWGTTRLYVDLGAERVLAAEKIGRKIAVEIKSFLGSSAIYELEQALGQLFLYQRVLATADPERVLYLAMQEEVAQRLFAEPMHRQLLTDGTIRLIVFSVAQEVILEWID